MNKFNRPIDYIGEFLTSPDDDFTYFSNMDWLDKTSARRELFFATVPDSYTYGVGEFARTYIPIPMDARVKEIGDKVAKLYGFESFELCFMNYYETAHQALGWHADDAESIDHSRPIAVVSVGAEREIWCKPFGGTNDDVEKIKLGNGSLLVMKPGMQHSHWHRIPKHDRPCGPRISLTFRAFKH